MSVPLKAFLIDWDGDHWVEVARQLAARGLIEPVCWTAYAPLETDVRAGFPDVLFHDIARAVRGLPPRAPHPHILPGARARKAAGLEAFRDQAVLMMDRMDPDRASFPRSERDAFFDDLAAYWEAALTVLRPDIVLFSISPHTVYDYVVYALCRCLDIPTVMFDRTALPERIVLVERLEEGSLPLRDAYRRARAGGATEVTLGDTAAEWWRRWRGSYAEGMPANLKQKQTRSLRAPGSWRTIAQQSTRLLRAGAGNAWRAPPNYLKERGRRMQDSDLSLAAWGRLSARGVLHKRDLERRYRALQRQPDLAQPYVFVALHYQPERNTSPIGGVYADQARLVDALSRALPSGWRLVIKEHGWQLHPQSKGERSRDAQFYDRLAALPNVTLCPIEWPSFDLIDQARAVATVSGSIGWEALCRGKPVLAFGAAWYAACDGVFRITADADCDVALAVIADGARPDEEKVKLFLAVLDATATRGIIEPGLDVQVALSAQDNARNLAAALSDFIETQVRRAA